MSTQSFFGDFEGFFGILEGTGLQQLDDSFFVYWYTSDFIDECSDEANSLSESSFSSGLSDCFFSSDKLGGGVSFILSDSDYGWVLFSHYIFFILIINIEFISLNY